VVQCVTTSFERLGREPQLLGDTRDRECRRERYGACP
jgi:hypothetical protein